MYLISKLVNFASILCLTPYYLAAIFLLQAAKHKCQLDNEQRFSSPLRLLIPMHFC